MRPDEHKKKKNTAYKKKHGISNKSTDNGADTKSKQKEEKNKTIVKTSDTNLSTTSTQRFSVSGAVSNSFVDSSGSGSDTEAVEKKKSYRRREVVSNWRKYELGPELDDGPVVSRGEDFNKLLNMAGETMSHFRFREELEWEDVKSGEIDGGEHDPVTSSFLSLDLADISSSMSCIPINQLLAIDQSLFPVDQLEAHTKSVNEKRSIYLKSCSERFSPNRKKEQTKTNTGKTSINVCTLSENSQIVLNNFTHESNHIELGNKNGEAYEVSTNRGETPKADTMFNDLSTHELKPESVKGDQTSPDNVSIKHSHPEGSLSLQDDELDQLLDMDVVNEEKNKQVLVQSPDNKSNVTSSSHGNSPTNHPSPKARVKDEEKEAEDLEDWLDSILD